MNDWTRVGTTDDIPYLEGRSITLGDRRIAIFALADGGYSAIDAACPHAGGPLADGIVADSCVTCPLHNRRFDLTTGECVSGGDEGVGTYDVLVRDGELFVRVAAPMPVAA